MPDFITITAGDFESFGLQIGAATRLIGPVSSRLVANIGKDTVEFAEQYPNPPGEFRASELWTPKQRRFFFAALRSGRIQVPYQRTGAEGRGWQVRLVPAGDVYTVEVYNNVPYRRYVQGPATEQARIHRGRWSSQEDIEAAAEAAMPRRMAEAEEELERLFLIGLRT